VGSHKCGARFFIFSKRDQEEKICVVKTFTSKKIGCFLFAMCRHVNGTRLLKAVAVAPLFNLSVFMIINHIL
jgi:hypothetical protein